MTQEDGGGKDIGSAPQRQEQRDAVEKEYRFRPSSTPIGSLPLEGPDPKGSLSPPFSSSALTDGASGKEANTAGDTISMQSVFGVELKLPESVQRRKAAAKALAETHQAREQKQYNAIVRNVSFRTLKYDRDLMPGDTLWQYMAPKPKCGGWDSNGRRR